MRTTAQTDGIILFAVLASITALALLAGTIAIIAASDIRMAAAYKRTADAFYSAESGVQYVKSRIQADLAANTLSLSAPKITVDYTAPAGMTFDPVRQLTRTANTNAFWYSVTGYESPARCTIEVVFRRSSLFEMGLFGDEQFDTKAYGSIYMFDSRETPHPTPSDSIGAAVLASNGDFLTHQDTFIDGSFELGAAADGTPGAWRETPTGGSDITGEAALTTDRIDPDPLGAVGGDLAADFLAVSATNDNAQAYPIPISGHNVRVKKNPHGYLTLPSGNYCINDLIIDQDATLNIQPTNGPVNIYLTGKFQANNDSAINNSGSPTDLFIYSTSTHPDTIDLNNSGDFSGLIYAPYASITVRNTGNFYGTAWGQTLELKNSGEIYIDAALMDAFPGNKITIISWKEVRTP